MEKSYGHKVDKYALIYTASDEISTYLRDINDRPAKYMDFYMKQIDKAATFIRFVESVCIISGAEILCRLNIELLWDTVIRGYACYTVENCIHVDCEVPFKVSFGWDSTAKHILEVIQKFKKECSEKQFATLTAPF